MSMRKLLLGSAAWISVRGIVLEEDDYYTQDSLAEELREQRERNFHEHRARVRDWMKEELGWTVENEPGRPSLMESPSRSLATMDGPVAEGPKWEALRSAATALEALNFKEKTWSGGMKKLVIAGKIPEADWETDWEKLPGIRKNPDPNIVKAIKLYEAREKVMSAANDAIADYGNSQGLKLDVYPTGSAKFTSDKDVQIGVAVCEGDMKKLGDIITAVNLVRTETDKVLKTPEALGTRYDINYYPPTILNTYGSCLKNTDLFWKAKKGDKMCWAPYTSNLDDWLDDVRKELPLVLLQYETTKADAYFNDFKATSTKALGEMIDIAKTTNKPGKTWNDKLRLLTRASAIGPEMYTCYSTTIYVVWHMQMKSMHDPLSAEAASRLAMLAVVENLIHYTATKKLKYKLRCCAAYNDIKDKTEYTKLEEIMSAMVAKPKLDDEWILSSGITIDSNSESLLKDSKKSGLGSLPTLCSK